MKKFSLFIMFLVLSFSFRAQTWNIVGSPYMDGPIYSLAVDSNNKIYAGYYSTSNFLSSVARWNFVSWENLGNLNANGTINKMILDSSNNLYCLGVKNSSNQYYIAKYNGSSWSTLGGLTSATQLKDIITDGTNIYVSGNFISTITGQTYYINKWDGTSWSLVDDDVLNGAVNSMFFDKDGNLVVGGEFTNGSGKYAVKKKVGNSWSEVGTLNSTYPINKVTGDPAGQIYAYHSYPNNGNPSALLSRYSPSTNSWVAFDYYYPNIQYVDTAGTQYATTNCGTPCYNIFKVYKTNTTPSGGVENYVSSSSGGQGGVNAIAMDKFGYLLISSYQTSWSSGVYGVVKSSTKFLNALESKINANEIHIAPNPFKDRLNIATQENGILYFYDTSGKLASTSILKKGENSLDKSSLSKGVYIYKIKNKDGNTIASGKVMKK